MIAVGLVVKPGISQAIDLAHEIVGWAERKKISLFVEDSSAQFLGRPVQVLSAEKLVERTDPIITLGGDGTLVSMVRHFHGKSPILLGVNFGQLGFLTEVSPPETIATIESVLAGKVKLDERAMLSSQVIRNGEVVFEFQALNDVVIQKGARERLPSIDVTVNGESALRARADGLIVATPTGSTAYSLSAGGSIVHPSLDAMLVTPMCAHTLTLRPLIVPLAVKLEVGMPGFEGKVFLSVDGQADEPLLPGDRVLFTKSPNICRLVGSPSKSYFDILRTKLNWSVPNKP